jgi:hypothetical protein
VHGVRCRRECEGGGGDVGGGWVSGVEGGVGGVRVGVT